MPFYPIPSHDCITPFGVGEGAWRLNERSIRFVLGTADLESHTESGKGTVVCLGRLDRFLWPFVFLGHRRYDERLKNGLRQSKAEAKTDIVTVGENGIFSDIMTFNRRRSSGLPVAACNTKLRSQIWP